MIIELHHPVHGVKFAYSKAEADQDKKNGWQEVQPKPEPKKKKD